MDEARVDIDAKRAALGLAFAAYEQDEVRLASRSLAGATHLVASRKGLYAVNEREWSLVAYGFFFGLTFRGADIYAFEACDQPHSFLNRGRVVRLERVGDAIVAARVLAKGLDNGCHQIDFVAGRLHVLDTYNQTVLRFGEGEREWEVLRPLPTAPEGRWDSRDLGYVHANSLLAVGERRLLLLHNQSEHTGRRSEVAVYDSDWKAVERWTVKGRGCHGLALLEDGTVLTCDSMAGSLVSLQGLRVAVSPYMTRGLAVGTESVVVGASLLARREERANTSGTVTFMDREYRVKAVLEIPGAPTEVRRLDGEDAGLSGYLERVPWGQTLLAGKDATE